MFPKFTVLTHAQRGFLLPAAVFILVIMSAFALVLWHNSIHSGNATVQALSTTQAFYAAESGAQTGLGKLFADTDISVADSVCSSMSLSVSYHVDGLKKCSATIKCELTKNNNASVYKITSTGQCGSGNLAAQRTVQAEALLGDEG